MKTLRIKNLILQLKRLLISIFTGVFVCFCFQDMVPYRPDRPQAHDVCHWKQPSNSDSPSLPPTSWISGLRYAPVGGGTPA